MPLDPSSQQWVAGRSSAPISGAGSYLMGTQIIKLTSGAPDDTLLEIKVSQFYTDILDTTGGPFIWDDRYHTSYGGYMAFGNWAGGAWQQCSPVPPFDCWGQEPNPRYI